MSHKVICFPSPINLVKFSARTPCLCIIGPFLFSAGDTFSLLYICVCLGWTPGGRSVHTHADGCWEHTAPSWKLACYWEKYLMSSNPKPFCMFFLLGFKEHTLFSSKCEKFNFKIKCVAIAKKQKWKDSLCHYPLTCLTFTGDVCSTNPSKMLLIKRLTQFLVLWIWII